MKKFKKIYIAFLSMALIFSFLAFSDGKILSNIITYTMVSADEFNNFTYTINNGSASINIPIIIVPITEMIVNSIPSLPEAREA